MNSFRWWTHTKCVWNAVAMERTNVAPPRLSVCKEGACIQPFSVPGFEPRSLKTCGGNYDRLSRTVASRNRWNPSSIQLHQSELGKVVWLGTDRKALVNRTENRLC